MIEVLLFLVFFYWTISDRVPRVRRLSTAQGPPRHKPPPPPAPPAKTGVSA